MAIYNMNHLYKLALAEGEGAGTAYEYYVKLNLLEKILKSKEMKNVLIYGLPEKYGYSLDFFYFCMKNGVKVYLYERRSEKILNLRKIIRKLKNKKIEDFKSNNMKIVKKINKAYDLILSCEVLQSMNKKELKEYTDNINKYSKNSLIFVPNKDNKNHEKLSHLTGFTLNGLRLLFKNIIAYGYIDMPPSSPGVKRKRKIKSSLIINLLTLFANTERFMPKIIKKKKAHICYIYANRHKF